MQAGHGAKRFELERGRFGLVVFFMDKITLVLPRWIIVFDPSVRKKRSLRFTNKYARLNVSDSPTSHSVTVQWRHFGGGGGKGKLRHLPRFGIRLNTKSTHSIAS